MKNVKVPWAKPDICKKELNEVMDSFRTNWLSMGPKVKKLEKALSSFLNMPHAVAVSNGTVALDLALKAIDIGPGDEVIVPAMTYFATASAVSYQHAVPVFADIEMSSFNLDPKCIKRAISKRTKALIFIDYGGNPADYEGIRDVARKNNLLVIQDGAQSLGGVYKGSPAGGQADISTVSFHMAKVMTTVEGGMVFTRDSSLKDDISIMRNQGEAKKEKYKHVRLGTNARMNDLQAAIGLAQFDKLPELLKDRKRVAARYDRLFSSNKDKISIAVTRDPDSFNAYFFYPILIDMRDKVARVLREKYGIDTRIAYPMPIYKQEAYSSGKLGHRKTECPVAEEVTSKILNLPIFPGMKRETIDYVCESILKAVG